MPKTETLIAEISDTIEAAFARKHKMWFGRTKFSVVHENRLRKKFHGIDLTIEWLYKQLWDLYYECPDDIEEISREKHIVRNRTVITYCDGMNHFVTTKDDDLLYGYPCNCE